MWIVEKMQNMQHALWRSGKKSPYQLEQQMPRRKGVFLGFLLIRPIITIQSFSSSSLYVQVRQEESFEEEATFARPPPPRRRPDSFQVAFHNNATMILMRMMKLLTVQWTPKEENIEHNFPRGSKIISARQRNMKCYFPAPAFTIQQ